MTIPAKRPVPLETLLNGNNRSADMLPQLATILVQSQARRVPPASIARDGGRSDRQLLEVIGRATVAGATTTAAGWAAELVSSAAPAFLGSLGNISAFGQLSTAAPLITFQPNAGYVSLPTLAPGGTPVSFVGEGAAIPVRRSTAAAPSLSPTKVSVIVVYTTEVAKRSSLETLLRTELRDAVGRGIDSVLFDNAAASSVRPAGLLNGLTPLTPTAGGGLAALAGDLSKLVAAIAPIGGNSIAFVCAPDMALRLAVYAQRLSYPVYTSAALAAGTVVAIALPALVFGVDEDVEITASRDAILHMEDTTPGQITTGAGAVSHPSQSMYQTGQIALRIVFGVGWALRATGAVAVINSATW